MIARTGILLLFISTSLNAGEIYRWVDERGQVHFSDKPVGSDAETLVLPATPASNAAPTQQHRQERQQRLLRAFEEERIKQREIQARARAEREQRQRRCHQVRDNLRSYTQAGGIYDLDENGNRVYMEEAQRQAYIAQWQQAVARWCR